MSTRCFISIETEPGLFKGVYCHYDGYPSGVGKILLEHYNNKDIINNLISNGDMSCLGETIDECRFYKDLDSPKKEISDLGDLGLTDINRDYFLASWCDYWYRYRLDGTWDVMAICSNETQTIVASIEFALEKGW